MEIPNIQTHEINISSLTFYDFHGQIIRTREGITEAVVRHVMDELNRSSLACYKLNLSDPARETLGKETASVLESVVAYHNFKVRESEAEW